MIPSSLRLLIVLGLLLSQVGTAEETSFLASRYSDRWREIQDELTELDSSLEQLPAIPLRDFEGPSGYAQLFSTPSTPDEPISVTIEIRWDEPANVELLALVPARSYGVEGLNPQFGLQDNFTLSFLNPEGIPLPPFAHEVGVTNDPVRSGHPFVYQLTDPVRASGIQIKIPQISRIPYGPTSAALVAWAEAFCFSGNINVARNARVNIISPSKSSPLQLWQASFLVDEVTPLGLPELPPDPEKPWTNIGWISEPSDAPDTEAWIQLDLGDAREFDSIRLFPALRPTLNSIPGFGMPPQFTLWTSDTGLEDSWHSILPSTASQHPDLGHNPLTRHFPRAKARFVKLHASTLWKPLPTYPAFLGFSELQLTDGDKNIALGATVTVSDKGDPVRAHGVRSWTPVSLTDGYGPHGKLVSTREWLILLDDRLQLERKQHELSLEADQIATSWSRGTVAVLAVFAILGLLAAIILPLRSRRAARNRLLHIRQRLAGDLHDDVGSNLGSIQLLSELARQNPTQERHLKSIQQIAAETVTSVRDIVWLLLPRTDHRLPTVSHLKETATILLGSLKWSFISDFGEESINLSDEQQRDLTLYFREALHNIIRHSHATEVDIHLKRSHSRFSMEIKDNGTGVGQEALEKHTFLRALKQRVTRLKGELEIDTAPGQGTRLLLTIPLPK